MRVVVHIGLEKTGTTSIQRHLANHRDQLASDGVLYPTLEMPGINHIALAAYAQGDDRFDDTRLTCGVRTLEELQAFRLTLDERLRTAVADARPRVLVLSSEHLSSRLTQFWDVKRLANLLTPLSDEIAIVAYLRPQEEFFVSSYVTFIKSGQTRLFPEEGPELSFRYDFATMLSHWREAFPTAHMIVRRFSKTALKNGDVIDDFVDAAGLSELDGADKPDRLNESLCLDTLEFLRLTNAHVPRRTEAGFNPHRGALVAHLEDIAGPTRPQVSKAFAEMVRARFAEVNATVAAEFFGGGDGALFDAPEAAGDEILVNRSLTPEKAAEISSHLWIRNMERIRHLERKVAKLQGRLKAAEQTRPDPAPADPPPTTTAEAKDA